MGLFDTIKDAQSFESGQYIEPGLYTLKISRVVKGEKRIGRIPFVVVEGKVQWSTNEKFATGATVSWYVGFDKDAAMGNVKAFLAVANECKLEEIDPAGAEMCFSDDSPLIGKLIDAEAYNKPTREGKPFTRVKWLKAGTLKAEADAAQTA